VPKLDGGEFIKGRGTILVLKLDMPFVSKCIKPLHFSTANK